MGEAATGAEALRMLRRTLPDVLLTDFRLPDMSGDVLCRKTVADFPATRVVILTTYLSEEIVRQAVDAGAHGFVTKAAGLGELRSVLAGVGAARSMLADRCSEAGRQAPARRRARPSRRAHAETGADPRAARGGADDAEIGERLFITESNRRFHIQRLKQRLGVANKAELIAVAIRSALIAPAQDAIGT